MGQVWLRRYSVLVAVCALLLVIAGGLVTSNDAALSIPDWPLAYGKFVPPLEGGIRLEFTHRILAAAVAFLTLILAIWVQSTETRRWVRSHVLVAQAVQPEERRVISAFSRFSLFIPQCALAWSAFATVIAQALLGGAAVKFIDPKPVSIAHACLAQLCFGIIVAVSVSLFLANLPHNATAAPGPAPLIAAAALLIQTGLGAALRHNVTSVVPHIVGAVVSVTLVMWAGLQILMQHMENVLFRRSAMALLSVTFSQVFLGLGAYMSRLATVDAPQPMPLMIWFTVAHVAAGSLAFGAAVALALIVYRDAQPANATLAHGGMAAA